MDLIKLRVIATQIAKPHTHTHAHKCSSNFRIRKKENVVISCCKEVLHLIKTISHSLNKPDVDIQIDEKKLINNSIDK